MMMKRVFDLFSSLVLLLISALPLLIIAFLVKITSAGPVLIVAFRSQARTL